MRLFRIKLNNQASQRTIACLYALLILSILFRPYVGILLPNLQESIGLDSHGIAFIFCAAAVYLWRAQPIHMLEYLFFLLPLAFFSGYVVIFMFTNTNSSIVTSMFILFAWRTIFVELKQSLTEVLE